MGRNKKYSGYEPYEFLEPDLDYKVYKFRDAVVDDWFHLLPVTKTEEERVEEILEKNILIDLHVHPSRGVEDLRQMRDFEHEMRGRAFIAYKALSLSGLDAFIDWIVRGRLTSKRGWKWNELLDTLGMVQCDIAHQDFIVPCKKAEDIVKAHDTGKVAWISGSESANIIENDVDRLDILYGFGMRTMGICFSEANLLGSGNTEIRDAGLTDFGYDAIVRMNKLGMLVDIGHGSNLTCLDAIESSKKPILFSHTSPMALTPTRGKPDEVLQALAEKDGVAGILCAPMANVTKKNPEHNIEGFMEHIEYCVDLMGIDHVGVGSDTYYYDHIGEYLIKIETGEYVTPRAHGSKIGGIGHYDRPGAHLWQRSAEALKKLKYVKGLENPTECVHNVVRWMVKHGYSDQEIAKIIGGNALTLFRKTW